MYPEELKYNTDSMWIKIENHSKVRTGITDYYQKQIINAIFVELPKLGTEVKKGKPFGSIESSKAINDLLSPVSGKVTDVNNHLDAKPDLINSDPYGKGWMVVIQVNNPEELKSLMSAKEYEVFIKQKPQQ